MFLHWNTKIFISFNEVICLYLNRITYINLIEFIYIPLNMIMIMMISVIESY